MEKFPTMVYKAPGPEFMHSLPIGLKTAITTSEDDLAAAKEAGWHETTTAAVEAYNEQRQAEAEAARQAAANANSTAAQPTRAELEVKAKELGIEFKANTTDAALLKLIEAKLKA